MAHVKAPKIERGTVKLRGLDEHGNQTECVADAFIYGGLAAHRPWNNTTGKAYRITHIASGKAFANFYGQRAARAALIPLASFTDWTQPESVILELIKGDKFGELRELVRSMNGY